jgi:hypothetical protein
MSLAAQSAHTMALWGPRRAISLKDARQRTALVHILRLLFTVGAVLSAGWLLGTVIESSLRAAGGSLHAHLAALSAPPLHLGGILSLQQGFMLTSILYAGVVAFVIDRSGSMSGQKLALARQAVVTAVERHEGGTVTTLESGKRIAADAVFYSAGRQGAQGGRVAGEGGEGGVGDGRAAVE